MWDLAMVVDGMPGIGSPLFPLSPVILEERRVRNLAALGGAATVEVTLIYRLQPPPEWAFPWKGGANLNQVESHYDSNGRLVVLTYKGESRIATFPVLEARRNFTRRLVYRTNRPDSIADDWVNKLNNDSFYGYSPGEWLCVSVEYEVKSLLGLAPGKQGEPIYEFVFEFERKDRVQLVDGTGLPVPDANTFYSGWDPVVSFLDENGRIPADVVGGQSIVIPHTHRTRNFGDLLVNGLLLQPL